MTSAANTAKVARLVCRVFCHSHDPGVSGRDANQPRWELSLLVGPCDQEAAEEFLLAIQHKFRDHLGAAYSMRPWDESDGADKRQDDA